jgi:hypothetical protein
LKNQGFSGGTFFSKYATAERTFATFSAAERAYRSPESTIHQQSFRSVSAGKFVNSNATEDMFVVSIRCIRLMQGSEKVAVITKVESSW